MFISCSADRSQHVRGIYMQFLPTTERLAHKEEMIMMFDHLINDLSAGDTIVIDSADQAFTLALSDSFSLANSQKIAFKKKLKEYINSLKEGFKNAIPNPFARAKRYLDSDKLSHKSIIVCGDDNISKNSSDEISGFKISILNMLKKPMNNLAKLEQIVHDADAKFFLISSVSELDQAIALK